MATETTAKEQPVITSAKILRECLASGLAVVSLEEKQVSLTAEAEQILGLPVTDGSMQTLDALPEPLLALAQQVAVSDRPASCRRVEVTFRNGGALSLQVSAMPVLRRSEKGVVVLALSDLTRARQFEANLPQVDRLASMGALAAGMAHEIKNALVACKTFTDLLLEREREAELAEVVRREMARIDAIVGRMLNFSAPPPPKSGPVRIHDVLEHSLTVTQSLLRTKGVTLKRSFEAASDLCVGDEYELEQAFVNLMLNAAEAVGLNGCISVQTRDTGAQDSSGSTEAASPKNEICVTIADNGTGIPPEHLARIFEPFFTTKPGGTGLGLAITQRIIQEHRGRLTVESEPGRGTRFHVFFSA